MKARIHTLSGTTFGTASGSRRKRHTRGRSSTPTGALLAVGAIAGIMLLATPSTGAAAATASAGATAAHASSSARMPAGLDVYRGWYWTYGNCDNAGRQGVDRGHWGAYQCAEGDAFWHLWTDR